MVKPAGGLRPHHGDLLLGRVLRRLGQGGGSADPVRDVGVDTVCLRDAVAVAVEVGDHDPVAEGQRRDGAAARAHLSAKCGQFVEEAVDAVKGVLRAAGHPGEALGLVPEYGDAPVGRVGTLPERVRIGLS